MSAADPEPLSRRRRAELEQLDLLRALPGDLAPRDAQDLMAHPFLSLAKSKRLTPIDFKAGAITIRVEATPEHGMATHLGRRRPNLGGLADRPRPRRRLAQLAPDGVDAGGEPDGRRPRGERARVSTPQGSPRAAPVDHRRDFNPARSGTPPPSLLLVNEWKKRADASGRPLGIELILPDWFYTGVLDDALVLSIDREYFALTGGVERWLYRIVRKHAGRQEYGWSFDLTYLHAKSGNREFPDSNGAVH
jgi:hypothetical protein